MAPNTIILRPQQKKTAIHHTFKGAAHITRDYKPNSWRILLNQDDSKANIPGPKKQKPGFRVQKKQKPGIRVQSKNCTS